MSTLPGSGTACAFLKIRDGFLPSPRRFTAGPGALSALDRERRLRIADYSDEIAATLARAGEALEKLENSPGNKKARNQAIRELGRITGYVETMVDALEHHLDGRKLAGVKRRLEQLDTAELHKSVVSGRATLRIDRLSSAEGYFYALADALRI